jgi:hypothetical protein
MKPSAFIDWVKFTLDTAGIDDQHIFRENQNGVLPATDYATIGVIACVPDDYSVEWKEQIDKEHGIKFSANKYTITVSVNVYSNDGFLYLDKLKKSPKNNLNVKQILKDNFISFIGCGGFNDLTLLGDTTHRPRYQSDFQFSMFATTEELIDLITAYYIGFTDGDSYFNWFVNVGKGVSVREDEQIIRICEK